MILGKHAAFVTGGGTVVGGQSALGARRSGRPSPSAAAGKPSSRPWPRERPGFSRSQRIVTDEAAMAGLYAEAEETPGPFDIVVAMPAARKAARRIRRRSPTGSARSISNLTDRS